MGGVRSVDEKGVIGRNGMGRRERRALVKHSCPAHVVLCWGKEIG